MSIRATGDVVTKLQADLLELKAEIVDMQVKAQNTRAHQNLAVKTLIGDLDRPWGEIDAHASGLLERIDKLLGVNEED